MLRNSNPGTVLGVILALLVSESAWAGALCAVYIDVSPSVSAEWRRAFVDDMSRTFPTFVDAFGCGRVLIVPFADEGPFARAAFDQDVPLRPTEEECTPTTPGAPDASRRWEALLANVNGLNEAIKENHQKERQKCLRPLVARHEADVRDFYRAAREAIESLGAVPPRGRCTALASLAAHVLDPRAAGTRSPRPPQGLVAVFGTDGISSCSDEPSEISVASDATTVFVLLPTTAGTAAAVQDAPERATGWGKRIQGLTVLLGSELSDWRWRLVATVANTTHPGR